MQMSGDARAGGLAQIHSNIEAVRMVETFQRLLGALRQIDQLMRGCGGQFGQAVEMGVGHHHHVAGGVREGVQADKAVLAAMDEAAGGFGFFGIHAVGDGVVNGGDQVAEDTMVVAGPGSEARRNAGPCGIVRRGDVGIAPGSPENIHGWVSVCISIECRRRVGCGMEFIDSQVPKAGPGAPGGLRSGLGQRFPIFAPEKRRKDGARRIFAKRSNFL